MILTISQLFLKIIKKYYRNIAEFINKVSLVHVSVVMLVKRIFGNGIRRSFNFIVIIV